MTGTKAATIFSPSPLTSHSDLVPLLLALDEMEMKMKGDIKGQHTVDLDVLKSGTGRDHKNKLTRAVFPAGSTIDLEGLRNMAHAPASPAMPTRISIPPFAVRRGFWGVPKHGSIRRRRVSERTGRCRARARAR
jgi:hypothetical protein